MCTGPSGHSIQQSLNAACFYWNEVDTVRKKVATIIRNLAERIVVFMYLSHINAAKVVISSAR